MSDLFAGLDLVDDPGPPRGRWAPAPVPEPPEDAHDRQFKRLLEGLCPGQNERRYAGWGREMRSLYGRIALPVLRGAVTRYLALEDDLPKPAEFAPYIGLAERAIARAERERLAKLAPPPAPSEAEQQAQQSKERRAIEAARATLPERLRKARSVR